MLLEDCPPSRYKRNRVDWLAKRNVVSHKKDVARKQQQAQRQRDEEKQAQAQEAWLLQQPPSALLIQEQWQAHAQAEFARMAQRAVREFAVSEFAIISAP